MNSSQREGGVEIKYSKPTQKYNYSPRADEEEDEEEDVSKKDPYKRRPYYTYVQRFEIQQTHFYLSDGIGDPGLYVDMIHRINTANPNDVIYIHLNTSGGNLNTGVQLINAMQNSQAKIVTVLDATAYSLGTLIFLSGDEMIVHDHCLIMFHNFRGGVIGKGQELAAELDATIKWFAALAKKIYVPFLSEDEFDRIIRGEDIWMRSPEIRTRLEKMIKSLSEEKPPRKKSPPKKTTKKPVKKTTKKENGVDNQ